MADLSIPKGQTYPHIRGYVADEDGSMSTALQAADSLSLVLDDGTGGSPLELVVEYVAPGEDFELNGQTIPVNWRCDYSESTLADSTGSWRAKLKIVHSESDNLVQYCPKDGFVLIDVTENVTESS